MALTNPQKTQRHIPQWTLGDRIKKAREDAGLEQGPLGVALSTDNETVGQSLVSKWEHDRREPKVSMLRRIADVLDVDEEWLLNGSGTLSSKGATLTLIQGGLREVVDQPCLDLPPTLTVVCRE